MSEPSVDHDHERHLAGQEIHLARQAAQAERLRAAGEDMAFVEALLGIREAEIRAMRLHLKPSRVNTGAFGAVSDIVQATANEPTAASVGTVKQLYDRMAPLYDVLNSFYEYSWKRRLRAVMFHEARGRLLDVGVGTGCNMPFYPKGQPAVGIDLSPGMLTQARARAAALGIDVELRPMDLLHLDFPDASFDTVAVTFVLLCLPDEAQLPALRELARVVRPDGRVMILDYHRASTRRAQLWAKALSGFLRRAWAGRFDPATERYIEAAGLRVEARRSFMGDLVIMLTLQRTPAS